MWKNLNILKYSPLLCIKNLKTQILNKFIIKGKVWCEHASESLYIKVC